MTRALVTATPGLLCILILGTTMSCNGPIPNQAITSLAPRRLLDRQDGRPAQRCLSADVGQALSALVAAGAFQPLLGNELTLIRGVVGEEIVLGLTDRQHQAHELILALPGSRAAQPNGHGTHFAFYLTKLPSAAAAPTLLAVGKLVDSAIPAAAVTNCAASGESYREKGSSRAVALGSAAVEVAILLTGVVSGLLALRPRNPERIRM